MRVGRADVTVSTEVLHEFERYPWPGNVRELSNAVERAVILATDGVVRRAALPSVLPRAGGVEPLDAAVTRAEVEAIRRALRRVTIAIGSGAPARHQPPRALRQARPLRNRVTSTVHMAAHLCGQLYSCIGETSDETTCKSSRYR